MEFATSRKTLLVSSHILLHLILFLKSHLPLCIVITGINRHAYTQVRAHRKIRV
ncbi:hypothetical protein HanXRQr2_Chr17g0828511 [Helianthus annuus]|uniref:Uncharacterized protein n=1 Tax=Helianthus annuus TaxID=4232 RepID=A0A251RYS1_HELAN|nr:hypothetical protein HanXRQr2_Chr17g0828511 [Helianthus annuus]KAJ0815263.1 hypothetical protein HanPSC8_Chr17g0795511 [Helianthus annuus]